MTHQFCKLVEILTSEISNLEHYTLSLLEYELLEPVADELRGIEEAIKNYWTNTDSNCKDRFILALDLIILAEDNLGEICLVTSTLIQEVNQSDFREEWFRQMGIKPISKENELSSTDFDAKISEMISIVDHMIDTYLDLYPDDESEI